MDKCRSASLPVLGSLLALWLAACGASHEKTFNRAVAFEENKAWAQAEETYRLAIRKRPDIAKYWNALGLFYSHRGLHEDALDCFNQAVELAHANGDYRRNRGIELANLGRNDEAESELKLAASLDAEGAHYYLGRLYMKTQRPSDAVREFEFALLNQPDDPALMDWLDKARRAAGQ